MTNQTLEREVFRSSRLGEYFTENEMKAQIGYGEKVWPVAVLRELIDNSLDACESIGVNPIIEVKVDDEGFSVQDNGPGIPVATVEKSLDYLYRVSDKAYYVAPTRGRMGNALKVVYAAPYVSTGEGNVEIIAQGTRHEIKVAYDSIADEPKIEPPKQTPFVKNGTFVKIQWPEIAGILIDESGDCFDFNAPVADYGALDFRWDPPTAAQLINAYAAFNPHATFIYNGSTRKPTLTNWKKWLPNMPSPAHWYSIDTLSDLIKGYLRNPGGHQKTIREFVSEFKGLSSTAKQKIVAGDFQRDTLSTLIRDGDINRELAAGLLEAMQAESKPPKPQALGFIGEAHCKEWLIANGGAPESIKYKKKAGIDDNGLPYTADIAFAYNQSDNARRLINVGLNWSPVVAETPDSATANAMQEARIDIGDPVLILIHIAKPRLEFMDKGKTRIELDATLRSDLIQSIDSATKEWQKEKQKHRRVDKRRLRQLREKPKRINIKEAAFAVMEGAYNHASSNGTYYANARQIMYAARPKIIELTGKKLRSEYFTQTLLKDYIEEHDKHDWKIVWDARGHFAEPHTGKKIGLGGYEVGGYMDRWHGNITSGSVPSVEGGVQTLGPENRYKCALFVEKEGFTEVLESSGMLKCYDTALMSTKGMSNKAACDLIGRLHDIGVRVLVLRDFDYDGFKIVRSLREGVRLSTGSDVIDIGLRGDDVEGLESEDVHYSANRGDVHGYLLNKCDATKDEAYFLASYKNYDGSHRGERVELNALTTEQLLELIERRLQENGVKKVIPDDEALAQAYRRGYYLAKIQKEIDNAAAGANKEANAITPPGNLQQQIAEYLKDNPMSSWDDALMRFISF